MKTCIPTITTLPKVILGLDSFIGNLFSSFQEMDESIT